MVIAYYVFNTSKELFQNRRREKRKKERIVSSFKSCETFWGCGNSSQCTAVDGMKQRKDISVTFTVTRIMEVRNVYILIYLFCYIQSSEKMVVKYQRPHQTCFQERYIYIFVCL